MPGAQGQRLGLCGPGQRTGSVASPSLTHSCPHRALTASPLAMSPSPYLRRSMAFGPSPRPSLQPPFMKRSPTQASQMACPRPVVHLRGWIESWKAATRRASQGANPLTGEAGAGIPSGVWYMGTHMSAPWRGSGKHVVSCKKCKAGGLLGGSVCS